MEISLQRIAFLVVLLTLSSTWSSIEPAYLNADTENGAILSPNTVPPDVAQTPLASSTLVKTPLSFALPHVLSPAFPIRLHSSVFLLLSVFFRENGRLLVIWKTT